MEYNWKVPKIEQGFERAFSSLKNTQFKYEWYKNTDTRCFVGLLLNASSVLLDNLVAKLLSNKSLGLSFYRFAWDYSVDKVGFAAILKDAQGCEIEFEFIIYIDTNQSEIDSAIKSNISLSDLFSKFEFSWFTWGFEGEKSDGTRSYRRIHTIKMPMKNLLEEQLKGYLKSGEPSLDVSLEN